MPKPWEWETPEPVTARDRVLAQLVCDDPAPRSVRQPRPTHTTEEHTMTTDRYLDMHEELHDLDPSDPDPDDQDQTEVETEVEVEETTDRDE